jgi:predicted MFS family arabinose efflux permease
MKPNGNRFRDGFFNYFGFVKNINPVIKFLIISDFCILSGFGFITPIFAVYLTNNSWGTVEVIGISETLFLLAKSLTQIPVAKLIDGIKGEKDDFWALLFGSMLFSILPLFYMFMSSPMHLYLINIFYGVFVGITLPAWFAIFTRHIDHGHTGIEWGAYRTLVDLGGAIAAAIGGFVAFRFGFHVLFILTAVCSFTGSLFISGIYSSMRKK